MQIHTDSAAYRHEHFRPYRLVALLLKAVRQQYPDYEIWRDFAYEYETDRLAVDLLSGGTFLRDWVDDPASEPGDFDKHLRKDERDWVEIRGTPPALLR